MSATGCLHNAPRHHNFTLILSGAEPTVAIADALIEAGCRDASLGSRCGVITLEFTRAAPSLYAAIATAIAEVAKSNTGLRVVRVEPDELVTASEIAKRFGRSKESIRLYALGKRGPGGFPPPLTGFSGKTPIYRWSEVACWADDTNPGTVVVDVTDIRTIGAVNAVLDLGRFASNYVEAREIILGVLPGAQIHIEAAPTGKPDPWSEEGSGSTFMYSACEARSHDESTPPQSAKPKRKAPGRTK